MSNSRQYIRQGQPPIGKNYQYLSYLICTLDQNPTSVSTTQPYLEEKTSKTLESIKKKLISFDQTKRSNNNSDFQQDFKKLSDYVSQIRQNQVSGFEKFLQAKKQRNQQYYKNFYNIGKFIIQSVYTQSLTFQLLFQNKQINILKVKNQMTQPQKILVSSIQQIVNNQKKIQSILIKIQRDYLSIQSNPQRSLFNRIINIQDKICQEHKRKQNNLLLISEFLKQYKINIQPPLSAHQTVNSLDIRLTTSIYQLIKLFDYFNQLFEKQNKDLSKIITQYMKKQQICQKINKVKYLISQVQPKALNLEISKKPYYQKLKNIINSKPSRASFQQDQSLQILQKELVKFAIILIDIGKKIPKSSLERLSSFKQYENNLRLYEKQYIQWQKNKYPNIFKQNQTIKKKQQKLPNKYQNANISQPINQKYTQQQLNKPLSPIVKQKLFSQSQVRQQVLNKLQDQIYSIKDAIKKLEKGTIDKKNFQAIVSNCKTSQNITTQFQKLIISMSKLSYSQQEKAKIANQQIKPNGSKITQNSFSSPIQNVFITKTIQDQNKTIQQLKKIIDSSKDYQLKLQAQVNRLTQQISKKSIEIEQKANKMYKQSQIIEQNLLKDSLNTILQDCYQKKVKQTQLLYKLDLKNKQNFHSYIDNQRNILLIAKTIKGKIIGGFSSQPFTNDVILQKKSSQKQISFLYDLKQNKIYKKFPNKNNNKYNIDYIIFGNSELRIKIGQSNIQSYVGLKGMFDTRQLKRGIFLGQQKQDSSSTQLITYQVYRIFFQGDDPIITSNKKQIECNKQNNRKQSKIKSSIFQQQQELEIKNYQQQVLKLKQQYNKLVVYKVSLQMQKKKYLQQIQKLKNEILQIKKETQISTFQLKKNQSLQHEIDKLKQQKTLNQKKSREQLQVMRQNSFKLEGQIVKYKNCLYKYKQQSQQQLNNCKLAIKQYMQKANQLELQLNQRIQQNDKLKYQSQNNIKFTDIHQSMNGQIAKNKLQVNKLLKQIQLLKKQHLVEVENVKVKKDKEIQIKNSQIRELKKQLQKQYFKYQEQNKKIKKNFEKLNEQKKYSTDIKVNKFFNNELLQQDYNCKQYLIQTLQIKLKKKIRKTILKYKYDMLNKTNFHQYVDNIRNLVLIVQLKNKMKIAAYSESAFYKGDLIGIGFLISLTNKKTFGINQRNPSSKSIIYDQYNIIFGNSELRIKSNDNKICSNFGILNNYYETNNETVNVLLGNGPKGRELQLQSYQFYQIIFQE